MGNEAPEARGRSEVTLSAVYDDGVCFSMQASESSGHFFFTLSNYYKHGSAEGAV